MRTSITHRIGRALDPRCGHANTGVAETQARDGPNRHAHLLRSMRRRVLAPSGEHDQGEKTQNPSK